MNIESQRSKNANPLWDLAIKSVWEWNRLSRLRKAFNYIANQHWQGVGRGGGQGGYFYPLHIVIQHDSSKIPNKTIFSKKNDALPSLAEYNLAYWIIEDIFYETRDNELLIAHRDACLFSSFVLKLLCRE